MRRCALVLGLVVFGFGCDADGGTFTDQMPDDLPAGSCEDTDAEACETSSGGGASVGAGGSSSGSSSSGELQDDCAGAESCLGDDACVAVWDPQTESRGAFTCRFACVPLLDETAWCSDDASCCDAGAICTPRGYCVLADDAGTTTGGEG